MYNIYKNGQNKHPGFSSLANSIKKNEGMPKEKAEAILAATTKNANQKGKKN